MILTAADVITASVTSAKAAIKPNGSEPPQQLPGIELIGPLGTAKFIHSLRHFMRRSAFEVRIREGAYFQKKNEKLKKQNLKGREMREESFHVQSIACLREDSHQHGRQKKRPRVEGSTQVLSFVFTTPPILGKFLADKAKSLGIPKGPLYGQLKAGKSVSFQNEKGEEQTVQSSEVR